MTRARMPPLRLGEAHKQVMRHLRMHGPTSRSTLSAQLNVSTAALTKLSRELLALGLIEEVDGDEVRARGRPAVPLRVSPGGGYAVGATSLKGALDIALVDYAGGLIAKVTERFDDPDPGAFAKTVRTHMHDLAKQHRLLSSRLLGVGIAVPGVVVSPDREHWLTVEGLSGWREAPLRQIMEDELGAPVWMENDGNAAALAEFYLGGGLSSYSDIVVILIGHGIGGGVIVDGRILKGQYGNAADLGVLYPMHEPRPSTVDLFSMLREHGCPISSVANFEEVTRDHQDVIDAWIVRAGQQLELLVNGGMAWFDPGAIVLSSALPLSLLQRLATHLSAARIVKSRRPQVREVTISRLGGAATALGAALLPIHATAAL